METQKKIFGIGLSKTGTTSLAGALTILGYRTRDYIGVTRYTPRDLSCIPTEELDVHDAFTDTPIPSFYRELDQAYPGSKFILTVRDAKGWLKSCKKQFTVRHAEIQNEATRLLTQEMYGCTSFDEEKFLAGYNRFVAGVKEYFKDRPQDLLILDLCGGEGWAELCGFLGKPVPDVPFPVSNVTEIQWLNVEGVTAVARRAGAKAPAAFIEGLALSGQGAAHAAGRGWLARLARIQVARCASSAAAVIRDGLSKLTPTTPVLFAGDEVVPYEQRKRWSYVWLVSCFPEATGNGRYGPLTLSIALVEGQRPKWGVVFIPSQGLMYYTKGEGGAFRSERGGVPDGLPTHPAGATGVLANRTDIDVGGRPAVQTSSPCAAEGLASALCAVADGRAAGYLCSDEVQQAHAAAGHAILRAVGKTLRACATGEELQYNAATLVHPPFRAG
ncbi:MAG TPA: hypothetical protein ENJ19_03390 [Gammaproteobacteria bacterium]|nr:hypothetical protein [Gammaproteobacteria bacterium]